MNYIITKNKDFFTNIGNYNYCNLEDMVLPETIAIDTETTGLKPINSDIFAVQIGTGKDNYLIHCYDNNYTFQDIISYIKDKELIGHNLTFDLGFFYKYRFYPEKTRDTFIASKILYNGKSDIRHDFGAVFNREMNIYYDKTEQKKIHSIKLGSQAAINYCFNDVDRLIELHKLLSNKIDNKGFRKTYDLHCNYIQALAYIEQCGLPISEIAWRNKIKKNIEILSEEKKKVIQFIFDKLPKYRCLQMDMFNPEIRINVNLASPKQMIEVFKDFNIPIHDDKGKESISENIIKNSSHEFVKLWLNYQSASHDVTTFGENILEKCINGRTYTAYNPILDTARISSRRGDVNTLNLPANQRTRECIVAEKGYSIVVCDYAGQENIVGADLTNDETMIASVVNDLDLHCAFARVLFPEITDLSDDEIKEKHKSKRNAAKSPRFAFAYGGNAFTISRNEGISIEEAQKIENAYKELHSGIYEYGNNKLKQAINLGYIESAYGFKLFLPNYLEFKEYEKKIKSITKDDWELYKIGKLEFKEEQKDKNYQIKNKIAYEFFKKNKGSISKFFKLKSQYFRLCLNNPTQTTAAHQTKSAVIALFNLIKQNNHIGLARIIVVPHDEIVMEVKEDLAEYYKEKLGEIMKEEGNKFLTNPLLKMNADANYSNNWYSAK